MKNKIKFAGFILIAAIITLSFVGCGNVKGGKLEIKNETGEDKFQFTVFPGNPPSLKEARDAMAKTKKDKEEDFNKLIATIKDKEKDEVKSETDIFISYYWWVGEKEDYLTPEISDFGTVFLEGGNTIPITAKKPE